MCLNLPSRRFRPRKARKNIKVYKVLEVVAETDELLSPYQSTPWTLKETKVEAGIRWDSTKARAASDDFHWGLHFGLHSFSKKSAVRCLELLADADHKLFNAVIPRGAEYYVGDDGEVISNKLKLIGELKSSKRKFK